MKNYLLVPLLISLLGNVASSSNDVQPPIGCEIHKLGDPNTEMFSPPINFTGVISATLNIKRESWQEFSFGFESSSKEDIGILKFSKDSNVSLTLKNWDSSNQGDKENTKLLPLNISSKLQSGKWIQISLKRSTENLIVDIANAEQIVFTEVETSQFHYVYAHVRSDQYIEVRFNCLDMFPGSTSVRKLDEDNSGESTTSGGGGGGAAAAFGIIFLIILVAAAIGGGIWFKKKREKQNYLHNGFLEVVEHDKDEETLYFKESEEFNPLLSKQSKCTELPQQKAGVPRERSLGLLSDTGRDVRVSSYIPNKSFDSTDNAQEASENVKCQSNDNPQNEEEKSVRNEMRSEGKTEKTASSEGISPETLGQTEDQLISAEITSSILEKEGKQTSGETVSDTNSTSGAMESENNETLPKHEADHEDSDTENYTLDNVERNVGNGKEEFVPKIACNKQEEIQSAQPEIFRDIPEDGHSQNGKKLIDNSETETEGMLESTKMEDNVTEENLKKVSSEFLTHNNDSCNEDMKSDTASLVNVSPDVIPHSKVIRKGTEEDSLDPEDKIMDRKMNEKELSDEKSPVNELNEAHSIESNVNVDISQDALNETEIQIGPTEPSSQVHEDENRNKKATTEEEALLKPIVDTADKQRSAVTMVKDSPTGIPHRDTNEFPNRTGENTLNSESEIKDNKNHEKEDEKSPTKDLNESSSTESNSNADISPDVLNEIESQIVPIDLASQIHEDQNRNTNEKATAEEEGFQKPPADTADKQPNAVKMGQVHDQSADRIIEDEDTNSDGKPAEVKEIIIVKMVNKCGENETTYPDRQKEIEEDNKDDTQNNVDIGKSQEKIGQKNTCDIQNTGIDDDNSPFHTKNSDEHTEDSGSVESSMNGETEHDTTAEVPP